MAKAPAGPRNLEDAVLAATETRRPPAIPERWNDGAIEVPPGTFGLNMTPEELRANWDRIFSPPPPPPAYPMPPECDDASLLVDCDRLEEIGSPLAEVLRRLPIGPITDQFGTINGGRRCIGGPWNNRPSGPVAAFVSPTVPKGFHPEAETHHYVEHTATWNGLTLRWYEWEPRHAQP